MLSSLSRKRIFRALLMLKVIPHIYEHRGAQRSASFTPFRGYSVSMRYILGFDGGGTKTECVLMNSADQVLARTYAGPSNPARIGVESAARAVEESAELALRETGLQRSAVTAGGAGPGGAGQTAQKKRRGRGRAQTCPRAAG